MAVSEDIVCVADLICLNPGVPKTDRMYFNILGTYHDSNHRLPVTPRSRVIDNVKKRIFMDDTCPAPVPVKNDLSLVRLPRNLPPVFWDRSFHPQFKELCKVICHLRSVLCQKIELIQTMKRNQRHLMRKIQILEYERRVLSSQVSELSHRTVVEW